MRLNMESGVDPVTDTEAPDRMVTLRAHCIRDGDAPQCHQGGIRFANHPGTPAGTAPLGGNAG